MSTTTFAPTGKEQPHDYVGFNELYLKLLQWMPHKWAYTITVWRINHSTS